MASRGPVPRAAIHGRLRRLDIVPTSTAWEYADDRFALAFWPWPLLAQDEPLPERILTTSADAIVDAALDGSSSSPATFSTDVRTTYADVLKDPAHAHAICEEYRAAASVDRQHDDDDRANRRRIRCAVLVLWSADGPLSHWYTDEGGLLTLWQAWAENLHGHAMPGGHFFPEESPQQTAAALASFFAAS